MVILLPSYCLPILPLMIIIIILLSAAYTIPNPSFLQFFL